MSPDFFQKGLTVTLLAIQPACSLFGPDCGDDQPIGSLLRVTAIDSQTEQEIEGPFTLTVISEASGDSLVVTFPGTSQPLVFRSFGAGGDYTVDLQREGYQRWRRSEIRVNFDGCGDPKTRSITAALVRL